MEVWIKLDVDETDVVITEAQLAASAAEWIMEGRVRELARNGHDRPEARAQDEISTAWLKRHALRDAPPGVLLDSAIVLHAGEQTTVLLEELHEWEA